MSRTDKDRPKHLFAQWWEPWHFGCTNTPSRRRTGEPGFRACDLPAEPDDRLYRDHSRYSCCWKPIDDRGQPSPPNWYIAHVYHRVQRQQARIDCRNAAKEYRARRDVDTVPTIVQGRNCGKYYYW